MQLFVAQFIQKYNIGTTANSQRLLETLVDKELILTNSTLEGVSYSVYNVFLSVVFSLAPPSLNAQTTNQNNALTT